MEELPPFKRLVASDIFDVFLNLEEFGETHNVNGKDMTVIFDDIENINREKRMKSHMDGLYVRQYFMYCAVSDFGPMPAQGSVVTVDRRKYGVVDAAEEMGILSITLEANRSR